MGVFNYRPNNFDRKAKIPSAQQLDNKAVITHNHSILSSRQHTQPIDNPDWKIVICTIRFYSVRVTTTLARVHLNVPYTVIAWGDLLPSTSNWKYQYVAQVLLMNPTDDNQITLKFQNAGYYTWGSGETPTSWSIRDNNNTYCIECFHIL